jgi:hypothetical protein
MSGSVGYHAGLAAEDIVASDYTNRHSPSGLSLDGKIA